MKFLSLLGLAISLLTIVPVSRGEKTEDELRKTVIFFPVVGAAIGFSGYLLLLVSSMIMKESISAILYISFMVIITGGLHIDGLSDTFDAFAAKSTGEKSRDYERRISIMEQGAQGPIGATSTFIVLLLKFEILKTLIVDGTPSSFLLLIPSVSRASLSIPIYFGKSAKRRGLGKIFIGKIGKRSLFLCLLICESLIFLILRDDPGLLSALISSLLSFCTSFLFLRLFEMRFGGITGDHLGAINELLEIIFPLFFIFLTKAGI